MNYLDKYDNFVMKKCLDTRRVNTFELNNLANGRVTKSHFGGYVAQKLTKKQLIVAIKSKFEGRYVNEKDNKKVIKDLEDLELAELLQIYESEYYWDNLYETGDVAGDDSDYTHTTDDPNSDADLDIELGSSDSEVSNGTEADLNTLNHFPFHLDFTPGVAHTSLGQQEQVNK